MIKDTCNARDAARMKRLASNGVSIQNISKTLKITEACVRRNLKGVRVAKDIQDLDVETEVVGDDAVEVTDEAEVADEPPPVLTPAQKAAATKKANAAKKAGKPAADAAADPEFLE